MKANRNTVAFKTRSATGARNALKQPARAAVEKGYKRVEVWLDQEATAALRFLMRDGVSARQAIESALIRAKRERLTQR